MRSRHLSMHLSSVLYDAGWQLWFRSSFWWKFDPASDSDSKTKKQLAFGLRNKVSQSKSPTKPDSLVWWRYLVGRRSKIKKSGFVVRQGNQHKSRVRRKGYDKKKGRRKRTLFRSRAKRLNRFGSPDFMKRSPPCPKKEKRKKDKPIRAYSRRVAAGW